MELGSLEIYQLSLKLSEKIWNIYQAMPNSLKYNIGDQTLRSIDSIGANIAEGYGRFHYKDSMKFSMEIETLDLSALQAQSN